jgi:hypothetical protein
MVRRLEKAMERWLAEEASRREAAQPDLAAETALREVFRRWPAPTPPRGFALAVLRRAGIVEPRRDVFASSGWLHAGIAASLVLAALSLLLMPAVARLARLAFEPGDVVDWITRGLVSASQMIAGALDVWGFLNRFAGALSAAVATPQVAMTLLAIALCAGGALRALDRLITAERSF